MNKRILSLILALLLIISGALVGCDAGSPPQSPATSATSTVTTTQTDPPITSVVPQGSSIAVHFIDVGQADATLIICDGETMLIDGGNAADSNLIYTYLQKNSITHLDYVVASHAHEDHVGGLSGALSYATVGTVYSPVTSYTTKAFKNFVAKVEAQGKTLTVPSVGDHFMLGSAEVTILGPVKNYSNQNNTSIVLRIVYGELSFLFTGDMESDAETDLIESGACLQSTVLKVGHHGSYTSNSYRFLREVAPTYGVISVGKDNSYGHPHESALSRFRDADVQLYRTDMQGDILCVSTDGKTVTFTTARNSDAVTNPTELYASGNGESGVTEYAYVGNLISHVFHSIHCSSVPVVANSIYFITREEAVAAAYTPCEKCKP